ncbi:MAG TPA: AI-2E family transporter [Gemmatimonadales bacterium]|nr:AI-2E family transporter [Gemmatimonadales bacterium]
MAFLDTQHQRAALVILALGLALALALSPYATGLIGIPVLYVIFTPLHKWLAKRVKPSLAATLVVLLGIFVIVVPGASFAGLIVNEAQQIATGVIQSPILGRLSQLRIGRTELGPELANLGRGIVGWLGTGAFSLVGTATRLALNLTIAFFGLYYLLLRPKETWAAVRPYIPFSAANADKLRQRFEDVTTSTLIGTGLTAVIQGALVAVGFAALGLANAVFWGVVTVMFAILPVVGSGMVWGPGVLALVLDGRYGAAVGLAVWGVLAIGSVDYIIRPIVFRRWAEIHPIVTLVGALAGVPYFGILGLLIGPLALSYFFELIRMYREEYLG